MAGVYVIVLYNLLESLHVGMCWASVNVGRSSRHIRRSIIKLFLGNDSYCNLILLETEELLQLFLSAAIYLDP